MTTVSCYVHRHLSLQSPLGHVLISHKAFSCKISKTSKPRDWYLEMSDCSEIWQAHRQHCCRCACQISKPCDNSNCQSCSFETSQHRTMRYLIWYWDGALVYCSHTKRANQKLGSTSIWHFHVGLLSYQCYLRVFAIWVAFYSHIKSTVLWSYHFFPQLLLSALWYDGLAFI